MCFSSCSVATRLMSQACARLVATFKRHQDDAIARCIAGRSAEHRSWGDRQPEKFLAGAAVINQGDQPGATSPADSTGYRLSRGGVNGDGTTTGFGNAHPVRAAAVVPVSRVTRLLPCNAELCRTTASPNRRPGGQTGGRGVSGTVHAQAPTHPSAIIRRIRFVKPISTVG